MKKLSQKFKRRFEEIKIKKINILIKETKKFKKFFSKLKD